MISHIWSFATIWSVLTLGVVSVGFYAASYRNKLLSDFFFCVCLAPSILACTPSFWNEAYVLSVKLQKRRRVNREGKTRVISSICSNLEQPPIIIVLGLNFITFFFCICWYDHMDFLFYSVNMGSYIRWFTIKPALLSCNKLTWLCCVTFLCIAVFDLIILC